ncbi:uncharacterized protein [Coffea arabica]|uniref:Reverse transcriptase domain-containing protein n=1 Tax=Coffea arabica TaxID=13443 RepID=A0ABM4VU48_COFAR
MRAVVWNFRDAGSPLTVSQLEEVVRLHSPELVFLAETKNKKYVMNKIRMRLRYDNLFVVDPIGRAGGLAVVWRKDLVVKRVLSTEFTIELNVERKGTEKDWWFVGILVLKRFPELGVIIGMKRGRLRKDLIGFCVVGTGAEIMISRIKKEIAKVHMGQQADKKGRLSALERQLTEAYKKEETYWGQNTKVQWLKEEDRNTKYFHAMIEEKRRRNNISILQRGDGTWCKSEGEVEGEINEYFRKVFTSNNPRQFDAILSGIPRMITGQMNNKLTKPVSEMEVRKSVLFLHPNKAPGLDAINETIITLIPKVGSPISVSQYRPISLYNVVYRIISKVLVNRLKSFLKHCISSNQSAFIPDRQIIDNIVVAHENDTLLFCRASLEEARQVMRILETYEAVSGQKINTDKSSVFFSKNTEECKKISIQLYQGQGVGEAQRLERKIVEPNWKGGYPRAYIRKYVVKWQGFGGGRVKGGERLTGWNEGSWLQEVLERGARKKVGDGRTVHIWKDRWLSDGGSGMVATQKPANCSVQRVYELIQNEEWNTAVMETILSKEDCRKIEGIPISLCAGKDKLVWPFTKTGQYSVKSGYMLARDMRGKWRSKE